MQAHRACNLIKAGFPPDNAIVLLATLAQATPTIDEVGMLFITLAKGASTGWTALDEAFLR